MSNREHSGRCVQAINRLTEVLHVEFDDLAPPDKVFVLSQALWQWHKCVDEVSKGNVS